MDYLKYTNHKGISQTFQKFTGWYIQNNTNLFSFSHTYEKNNYSNNIRKLGKNIEERDLSLVIIAPNLTTARNQFEEFFHFIETDIAENKKGRLVTLIGYYLPCIFKDFSVSNIKKGPAGDLYQKYILPLKIVTDEPYWFLDVPRESDEEWTVDFIDNNVQGTAYPMDMIIEIEGATSENAGVDFEYEGKTMHYGVDFALQSGQKLTINTREKSLVLYTEGEEVNVYNNRVTNGHSIYEQLPPLAWNVSSDDISNVKITFITRRNTVLWD